MLNSSTEAPIGRGMATRDVLESQKIPRNPAEITPSHFLQQSAEKRTKQADGDATTEGFPSSSVVFQTTGGVAKILPISTFRKKQGP
jgi:hypothetical protein